MQDIRAEHTGVPINSRHLDQGGRLRTPGRAGEPGRLVQRAGSVDPSSHRSDHQNATALGPHDATAAAAPSVGERCAASRAGVDR
jgi:hypothetical protein